MDSVIELAKKISLKISDNAIKEEFLDEENQNPKGEKGGR